MPDDDLDPTPPLHSIQPVITEGYGRNGERMRVPGGWLYWVEVTGGAYVSTFVPDEKPAATPHAPRVTR